MLKISRTEIGLWVLLLGFQVFLVGAIVFALTLVQNDEPSPDNSWTQGINKFQQLKNGNIDLDREKQSLLINHCLILNDAVQTCVNSKKKLLSDAYSICIIFAVVLIGFIFVELGIFCLRRRATAGSP